MPISAATLRRFGQQAEVLSQLNWHKPGAHSGRLFDRRAFDRTAPQQQQARSRMNRSHRPWYRCRLPEPRLSVEQNNRSALVTRTPRKGMFVCFPPYRWEAYRFGSSSRGDRTSGSCPVLKPVCVARPLLRRVRAVTRVGVTASRQAVTPTGPKVSGELPGWTAVSMGPRTIAQCSTWRRSQRRDGTRSRGWGHNPLLRSLFSAGACGAPSASGSPFVSALGGRGASREPTQRLSSCRRAATAKSSETHGPTHARQLNQSPV
jgi:hypothetical protein